MRSFAPGRTSNGYLFLKSWFSLNFESLCSCYTRFFVDPPSIVIYGKPSAKLADKLEKDETKRVAKQVQKLGPEGLKKAEAELELAKTEHDRPIPNDILATFPVPDVKSISWIPVATVQEPGIGRKPPTFIRQN